MTAVEGAQTSFRAVDEGLPKLPAVRRRPLVAAVILDFESTQDTLRCVNSLRFSDCLDLEILVVHNAPAGEAFDDLARRLGPGVVTFATGMNMGYAGGNNVGIRYALETSAEFIWILNPDTIVEPNTLSGLIAAMREFGDAGVVGPRVLSGEPGDRPRIWSDGGVVDEDRCGATYHQNSGLAVEQAPGHSAVDVDYVTGACLLLRRSAVESTGGLPEKYFLYFEETEYCRKMQSSGWRTMVVSLVEVWHAKRSSGELPTAYFLYYMTRNRLAFAREHFGCDESLTLADFKQSFLDPWRAKVQASAPDRVEDFDRLVQMAVSDAIDRVWGRKASVDERADLRPKG